MPCVFSRFFISIFVILIREKYTLSISLPQTRTLIPSETTLEDLNASLSFVLKTPESLA